MASGADSSSGRLVTVFQATNADLRELYLGATDLLMDRLAQDFASRRPQPAAHWQAHHAVSLLLIAYAVPVSDVCSYLDAYKPDAAYRGWKILREA